MNSKEYNRLLRYIPSFYGIIVVLANICGILIPNGLQSESIRAKYMDDWIFFLDQNASWTSPPQYLTFLVPIIFCLLYTCFSRKKMEAHFINLPVVYSTIGIMGWVTYFFEEVIFLLIAKKMGYHFSTFRILATSLLYISLEAVVTFSLAFFIMETIHRKYVLKRCYPEGKVSQIPGTISPGTGFLFRINYISVTVFPILYLLIAFISTASRDEKEIDSVLLIILVLIIVIGLIINFSLEMYFRKPLALLKTRIQKMKEGDYTSRVNFVSNDAFGELSDSFNEMTESILEKNKKLRESQDATITGLAIMVEMRDGSTGGHIQRTSDCIKVFAAELKKDKKFCLYGDDFYNNLIKAAPMHDLGKVAVDDAILRKNGRFTDDEYEKMKEHAAAGAKTVERVLYKVDDQDFKKIAINVAHYHHEKWDGSGYPEKISGTEIPFEARVMALADVFDALVSKRCYKEAFSYDRAFSIIEESLGTHFDPELGRLFIDCRPQLEALYNRLEEENER